MLCSIKLYFTVETNNCGINWAWRLGVALGFLILAEQDVWICRISPQPVTIVCVPSHRLSFAQVSLSLKMSGHDARFETGIFGCCQLTLLAEKPS